VYIYDLFQLGDLADAAAVSSVFLLIAFALFLLVRIGERSGWVPWRRGELAP
jgi:ABC-type sulfate transport system permease component